MSVVGKRYTLINVCEELSGDEVNYDHCLSRLSRGCVAEGGGCSRGFFGQVGAV